MKLKRKRWWIITARVVVTIQVLLDLIDLALIQLHLHDLFEMARGIL